MKNKLLSMYGENTFNDEEMKRRFPKEIYLEFIKCKDNYLELSNNAIEIIANTIKIWAIEKDATHYCHLFFPLNGRSSGKQNSFIELRDKNPIYIKVKSKINMKYELEYYDLVFTRAGATTLLEVLKSGVEIVCIPSPYVKNNHQEKNAKYFEKYISIIKEKDFTKENIEAHIVSMKRKNTYKIDINPIDKIINEVEND
ncbi:MAG: hypothetical protein E7180_00840 [Erysipelotrichaceae bacterium]|nr:hypothetical protein [Erysipelotrichaceae bacterium]